jgi:hypothetical protein
VTRGSTDLTMKGTKGRDCSPVAHQQRYPSKAASRDVKTPPRGVAYTGVGTPIGGTPPEASGKLSPAQGVLDPAQFNVDGHYVRALSRYWEGKRTGPDWLHQRVEEAQRRRMDVADDLQRRS